MENINPKIIHTIIAKFYQKYQLHDKTSFPVKLTKKIFKEFLKELDYSPDILNHNDELTLDKSKLSINVFNLITQKTKISSYSKYLYEIDDKAV